MLKAKNSHQYLENLLFNLSYHNVSAQNAEISKASAGVHYFPAYSSAHLIYQSNTLMYSLQKWRVKHLTSQATVLSSPTHQVFQETELCAKTRLSLWVILYSDGLNLFLLQ